MKRETLQDLMRLNLKNGALWRGVGILTLAFLLSAGLTACGDDEPDSAAQEDTMEQPSTDSAPERDDMGASENDMEASDNVGSQDDVDTMRSDEINNDSTAEMPTQEEAMPQSNMPSDAQTEQPSDQSENSSSQQ